MFWIFNTILNFFIDQRKLPCCFVLISGIWTYSLGRVLGRHRFSSKTLQAEKSIKGLQKHFVSEKLPRYFSKSVTGIQHCMTNQPLEYRH